MTDIGLYSINFHKPDVMLLMSVVSKSVTIQ